MSQAWKEKAVRLFFTSAAFSTILIVALIFLFVGREGVAPGVAGYDPPPTLAQLADTRWIPVALGDNRFGLVPLLVGSFLVTVLAIALALPFGVAGAVYIAELTRPAEREVLKPLIELLAGIPSVVLGFFGLVVLSPVIRELFDLGSGLVALTGAVLLAFMAVPTIISISEDAIRAVPQSYREASLALGATRVQTVFRVVVPAASSGIFAAVMLGIGRVIGETMAVLMVTGNAPQITMSPLESVRTITATIASEMGDVRIGSTHYRALFVSGIVLLAITFVLNTVTQRVLRPRSGE